MNTTIIFDLDGTLIDSAAGVLAAFGGAFNARGIIPSRPLSLDIIGPPLMETLGNLAGTNELAVLQPLAEAFKANYDEDGYRLIEIFPGMDEMLSGLSARGHELHIATNKRILPTRRILAHLGWEKYFQGVYALDAFSPPLKSKANMLGAILAERGLDPRATLYIGDRQEDGEAALANNIRFLLAVWGYDELGDCAWEKLFSPDYLMEMVGARND